MKKLFSLIVSAMLALTALPAGALAQTDVNLDAQNGRLLISEAGTYTLTGSMRGTLWVDPGQGDVTLIMDNMRIDGGEGHRQPRVGQRRRLPLRRGYLLRRAHHL